MLREHSIFDLDARSAVDGEPRTVLLTARMSF